jgi:YD repeat-containing protein
MQKSDWLFPSNTVDTYQYVDGLNRLVQERKESPAAGIYFVTDRVYNKMGQIGSTTLPYASAGSSYTPPSGTNALYTKYFYDALQRVTTEVTAVGTKTNSYYKWRTRSTDQNSNVKDYWQDAFGNLADVVENISVASIATTTYTYDAQNNLATTTDSLGNVRAFTYDGLGRRLTAQDLHYATDTTFGVWTYTYDHQGNITSQTDPKSQVVNRTYDALNRMRTEDYTGQSGTEITLIYDACTNGIGYLCSASSTSATSTNKYDILGRLEFATTSVLNTNYNMRYMGGCVLSAA